MTRETKKLFKVKRKITPLTVLVPLLLVVLLVCAVIYDNSRIVLDEGDLLHAHPSPGHGRLHDPAHLRHPGALFGAEGEALDEALGDSEYDIVVMTGDLVSPAGDDTGLCQALDYFAAKQVPVYFITGEGDPPTTEIRQDGSFGATAWAQNALDRGAVFLDVPSP